MPIQVAGLRQYLRAAGTAEAATKKVIRDRFRVAGDIVKRDAASRFQAYDTVTAAGYRTAVRQRGIAVEQKLRKTTGLRPDFGRLQMRKALMPALEAKAGEVEQELISGLNELAHIMERL